MREVHPTNLAFKFAKPYKFGAVVGGYCFEYLTQVVDVRLKCGFNSLHKRVSGVVINLEPKTLTCLSLDHRYNRWFIVTVLSLQ